MQVSRPRSYKASAAGIFTTATETVPFIRPSVLGQRPPHVKAVHRPPSTWEIGALYMCG